MATEFNKNIINDEKLSKSIVDKKELPQNIEAEQNILEAMDICKNMNDVGYLGMCHRALGTMYLDKRNWK